MATPTAQWNDLTRGATQWIKGADEEAQRIGMQPILSGARTEDEGLFVIQHTNWSERMGDAIAKERLFELVFPGEADVSFDAIEVVVYRLRKKIAHTGAQLVTLRGLGYLLKATT